jgi:hypothetical protein
MLSVVDRLSLKILGSQAFRRVVSREQREQMLQAAGQHDRSKTYRQNQLHKARYIEVELAVLGEIKRNNQGLELELWLVEVDSGDTLYNGRTTYANTEKLSADADRLARILVQASRQLRIEQDEEPRVPKIKPELEAAAGFGLGQENATAAPGIDGGSYFYAEVLTMLNNVLGISVKYQIGLFPRYSPNHLIMVLPRLNIRWQEDLYSALSFAYLISTDYRSQPYQYLGARICPVHSGDLDGISIELLPVTVLFNLENGQLLFMLQLLSFALWPTSW